MPKTVDNVDIDALLQDIDVIDSLLQEIWDAAASLRAGLNDVNTR